MLKLFFLIFNTLLGLGLALPTATNLPPTSTLQLSTSTAITKTNLTTSTTTISTSTAASETAVATATTGPFTLTGLVEGINSTSKIEIISYGTCDACLFLLDDRGANHEFYLDQNGAWFSSAGYAYSVAYDQYTNSIQFKPDVPSTSRLYCAMQDLSGLSGEFTCGIGSYSSTQYGFIGQGTLLAIGTFVPAYDRVIMTAHPA